MQRYAPHAVNVTSWSNTSRRLVHLLCEWLFKCCLPPLAPGTLPANMAANVSNVLPPPPVRMNANEKIARCCIYSHAT
jgi:hypothetical protein